MTDRILHEREFVNNKTGDKYRVQINRMKTTANGHLAVAEIVDPGLDEKISRAHIFLQDGSTAVRGFDGATPEQIIAIAICMLDYDYGSKRPKSAARQLAIARLCESMEHLANEPAATPGT